MKSNHKNLCDKIWIIADNRPGTYNQAIALAEALGYEFEIIRIDYNFLAKIPNIILQYLSISFINKKSKLTINKLISEIDYIPKFIISSGRRSSLIALYFKKKLSCRIIQIMNPNISFKKFDFVILPNHDKTNEINDKNLLISLGSLTRINEKLISEEKVKFQDFFEKINKKILVLLVGGNSKNNYISTSSIKFLIKKINKLNEIMNYHLIILNSRRTPKHINKIIKQNISTNCDFINCNIIKKNPYIACLGYGDIFIATGDSVSMISEACSTGKPVFIFDEKKISSPKHRRFHQQLYKKNYAKKFDNNFSILKQFKPNKLQEAKRLSSIINSNINF